MTKIYTSNEMQDVLKGRVNAEGTHQQYADIFGVDRSFVSGMISGREYVTNEIADDLGYTRLNGPCYVKKEKS